MLSRFVLKNIDLWVDLGYCKLSNYILPNLSSLLHLLPLLRSKLLSWGVRGSPGDVWWGVVVLGLLAERLVLIELVGWVLMVGGDLLGVGCRVGGGGVKVGGRGVLVLWGLKVGEWWLVLVWRLKLTCKRSTNIFTRTWHGTSSSLRLVLYPEIEMIWE